MTDKGIPNRRGFRRPLRALGAPGSPDESAVGGLPTNIVPGSAAAAGTSPDAAAVDHVHGAPPFGQGAGEFAEGSDPRFSDARVPTPHKDTHAPGGSDPIPAGTPVALVVGGSNVMGVSTLSYTLRDHKHALPPFGQAAGEFCQGNDARLSDARAPTPHGASHAPGSADAIATGTTSTTVCVGNDARLSDARTPTTHASTHAPGGPDAIATGTTGTTVCIGNDSRLSNARTPTTHATSHITGGADQIPLATWDASGLISANDRRRLSYGWPMVNQCRLSGDANNSVMLADNAAISTIHLVPHVGDIIWLYSSVYADWFPTRMTAGTSLALTGMTAGRPYDVFAFYNASPGGTVSLEILAWVSTTARATALVNQGHCYTKAGDMTRRYVGTIYAKTATTCAWTPMGGLDNTPAHLGIFNAENRVQIPAVWNMGGSWTVPTATTWLKWGGFAAAGIELINGLVGSSSRIDIHGALYLPSGTARFMVTPSIDTAGTRGPSSRPYVFAAGNTTHNVVGTLLYQPPLGLFQSCPLVYSESNTVLVEGNLPASSNSRAGMLGQVWC